MKNYYILGAAILLVGIGYVLYKREKIMSGPQPNGLPSGAITGSTGVNGYASVSQCGNGTYTKEEVKKIQRDLNSMCSAGLAVDGCKGPKTTQALQACPMYVPPTAAVGGNYSWSPGPNSGGAILVGSYY